MRKRGGFGSLLGATVAAAMAAALAAPITMLVIGGVSFFAPIDSALAQTPGTAGPVTINDLFTGDSVDLNRDAAQKLADAARKAQAPGQCPLGRLTINTPAGEELFQLALGQARRDVVLAFLDRQGINASRFFADVKVGGTQSNVRLDYNVARDDIAPTLDVQWTPPKGTKVRVGTRITAKAIARDDANRWQTGIKTIDLDVQGGGQFGFGDYPQPQPPCESPPPPRTLEGVYTVPANPPPIVRLRARTNDFANHHDTDIGEFPTGDWYGQIKWSMFGGDGVGHHGTIDIAVSYDGRGNLTGRVVGTEQVAAGGGNPCKHIFSTPPRMSANVVGQYTPGANTMSVEFAERDDTMGLYKLELRT